MSLSGNTGDRELLESRVVPTLTHAGDAVRLGAVDAPGDAPSSALTRATLARVLEQDGSADVRAVAAQALGAQPPPA